MRPKKIIVCVTNDLVTDQRVHKICLFLHEKGFDVALIGRLLPESLAVSRPYKTKRMKLLFNKGALFYMNYNFCLFLYLLFTKHHKVLANDLDTLLACYIVSKIKRSELIYDSHEYFTEVPELINRPKIKRIWLSIEKFIFPKLKKVYTVNESLAQIYTKKYNVKIYSIMNLPFYGTPSFRDTKNTTFTVIYQGSLNKDRGLEELISAFNYIENAELWIVGDGDLSMELRELVENQNLSHKIKFWGRIPFEKLKEVTQQAHLGVSLEKGTNLNYQIATPNKVFDYIAAGLPVLTSQLKELERIVSTYKFGKTIKEVEPKNIAQSINQLKEQENDMRQYKQNALNAYKELNWEVQEEKLKEIFEV